MRIESFLPGSLSFFLGVLSVFLLSCINGDDEGAVVVGMTAEVVGDALLGRTGELGEGGTAQVEVDAEHTAATDGEGRSEVGTDEGLAAAGVEGGEHDGLALLLGVEHELEVRAHHAEGLVGDVAAVLAHHNLIAVVLLALLGMPQGQLADIGHGEVLDVLAATHLGVAGLTDDEEGGRQGQADAEGDQENAVAVGRGGLAGPPRRSDDAAVIGSERLGQHVLLAALQKEDVELLLDAVLALDALQVVALAGRLGHLADSFGMAALSFGKLGIEGETGIVDGDEDGLAQVAELDIHVTDERVLLAAVGNEVVALEHHGVVLGDLGLGSTDGGWQQAVGIGWVGDEGAQVADHVDLCLQVDDLLVGGLLAGHGLSADDITADHGIGTEVVSKIVLDLGELLLDDLQTVADELVGGNDGLVAVLHPLLVIDGDDGAEDIVGTEVGHVVAADIDDARRILLRCGGDAGPVIAGGCAVADAADEDLVLHALAEALSGTDGDGAQGRPGLLADAQGRLAVEVLLAQHHVGEGGRAVAVETEAAGGGVPVGEVVELDLGREGGPIEGTVLEEALAVVVDIEVEAAHHLGDDGGGVDGDDLVGDLGADIAHAHLLEDLQLVAPLSAVLDEDGGDAGVDLGGGKEVKGSRTQADDC